MTATKPQKCKRCGAPKLRDLYDKTWHCWECESAPNEVTERDMEIVREWDRLWSYPLSATQLRSVAYLLATARAEEREKKKHTCRGDGNLDPACEACTIIWLQRKGRY